MKVSLRFENGGTWKQEDARSVRLNTKRGMLVIWYDKVPDDVDAPAIKKINMDELVTITLSE